VPAHGKDQRVRRDVHGDARRGEKHGSTLTGWSLGMGPGRCVGAEVQRRRCQDVSNGGDSAWGAHLDPGCGVASWKRKGGAAMAVHCALGRGMGTSLRGMAAAWWGCGVTEPPQK
jgi:hypothetical protein